ncbi:hypothetical protein Q4S45_15790 [Massilia sp. R2A-15]|nr:hypothetical protein [Massilia sp. R2A-15]WLI88189.1 hypothetical protein Q4S45_15790 [Massilia sp. R2A-15]
MPRLPFCHLSGFFGVSSQIAGAVATACVHCAALAGGFAVNQRR